MSTLDLALAWNGSPSRRRSADDGSKADWLLLSQLDGRPSHVRMFHFRLILATALRLHRMRLATSKIVMSVPESRYTSRGISSSPKPCPATDIGAVRYVKSVAYDNSARLAASRQL